MGLMAYAVIHSYKVCYTGVSWWITMQFFPCILLIKSGLVLIRPHQQHLQSTTHHFTWSFVTHQWNPTMASLILILTSRSSPRKWDVLPYNKYAGNANLSQGCWTQLRKKFLVTSSFFQSSNGHSDKLLFYHAYKRYKIPHCIFTL